MSFNQKKKNITQDSKDKTKRRVCVDSRGKCIDCYLYGSPCANCKYWYVSNTDYMTYEEFKSLTCGAYKNVTYGTFCKQKVPKSSVSYDDYYKDSFDIGMCYGPYNENYTRCFGGCCN